MRLMTRSVADHRHVESFAAVPTAVITSEDGRPLPVEADGEYLGEHHRLEFGVAPGALRVVA
jgi:diacylglycerol kinase family enzyme